MKTKRGFSFGKALSPDKELRLLKKGPAKRFEKAGESMAIELFRFASGTVPAYRDFLRRSKSAPSIVRTIEDFKKIPIVTKDSYLRSFPYESLFPNGKVPVHTTFSATSGSTGEPFYFPREEIHDEIYEQTLALLLRNQWQADKRRTLCLIGFGLGIWIGGVFTYKNLNALSRKGYPLSIAPVGVHIPMLLKTFKKLAPHFDQTILMSYPPFLKDLLDEGESQGIDWRKHRVKILTAAEGYSEKFRSYLADVSGADPIVDMVNIYGTVEQGTIAHETAFGNLIRKLASENKKLFADLFPRATNVPTLAQYDPRRIYFEEIDGTIVATGYGSSIPLVRYSFADLGGVISYETMLATLAQNGLDIVAEAKKYGISDMIIKLPFVYVYARADFAVVFRGANLYPDEIKDALDGRNLRPWITGRFSIKRRETKTANQKLDIRVELKHRIAPEPKITMKVQEAIVAELRSRNTEYNNNYLSDPKSSTPNIILHPYRDPKYFDRAGKQRWVSN